MNEQPEQPPPLPSPGYVSPYGKPRGLRARLVPHRATLGSHSVPWTGLGLVADVDLIMQILNKREWLETMHKSDDPDAQRFAAELLADDETLDAAWNAAEHARALQDADDVAEMQGVRIEPEMNQDGTCAWASTDWEIVQVWDNGGDTEDEYFGVSVPGLPITQWVADFCWGPRIPPYRPNASKGGGHGRHVHGD